MANRQIQGELGVSSQAVDAARYIKEFFEEARDETFAFERIVSQGSWGVIIQMIMRSSDDSSRTSEPSSSTPYRAPRPQPLPLPSQQNIPSPRYLDPLRRRSRSPERNPIPQPARIRLESVPRERKSRTVTRFIMKRSLAEVGEKNIAIEIDALDRLRRSMHIAQPSHVLDDPRWDSLTRPLRGPMLLMEWIENGLLWDFYERRAGSDEPLPNRLLWSLFLCLCRMVAGMAWPPRDFGRKAGGKPILEVIPPRNQRGERPPKSRLLHGDFHGRNVMIDKLEPVEHKSIPLLKLIDFGMSRDLPIRQNEPEDIVVKMHIRAVGEVMLGLLRGNVKGGPGMMNITYKGQPKILDSYATDLDRLSSKYGAPADVAAKHQDRIDNLDPELRSLVALCVAVKVEDRPDIEYLLRAVEKNTRDKRPSDYRNYKYANNETDAAIDGILAECIFNA
ncbi:hypothetical protein F5Y14DRAFT_462428 [Nemania sp. NC0429]|nr:hypothetical protein F5Y14DRAFT_462428 [Nemania sp. NC0429]